MAQNVITVRFLDDYDQKTITTVSSQRLREFFAENSIAYEGKAINCGGTPYANADAVSYALDRTLEELGATGETFYVSLLAMKQNG